jgi:hypothetical protein
MIGKRAIEVKRPLTLDELIKIMVQHWDRTLYSVYEVDMPTDMRIERCIVIPGTSRFVVTIQPRVSGNFFNKNDQVVLAINSAPEVQQEATPRRHGLQAFHDRRKERIHQLIIASQELSGPIEEVLTRYTDYMTQILKEEGLAA